MNGKDFPPIDSYDATWEFDAPKFTDFANENDEDLSTNADGFFVERKESASLRPAKLFPLTPATAAIKDEPSLIGCESEDEKPETVDAPIRRSSRMAARRSSLVMRTDDALVLAPPVGKVLLFKT